jgi:hypothetical protein
MAQQYKDRIIELEDMLKQRDQRTAELRDELDELRAPSQKLIVNSGKARAVRAVAAGLPDGAERQRRVVVGAVRCRARQGNRRFHQHLPRPQENG